MRSATHDRGEHPIMKWPKSQPLFVCDSVQRADLIVLTYPGWTTLHGAVGFVQTYATTGIFKCSESAANDNCVQEQRDLLRDARCVESPASETYFSPTHSNGRLYQ